MLLIAPVASTSRLRVFCAAGPNDKPSNRAKSNKGKQFENAKRRRGRSAEQRSPDDSPLRDGNRDRLVGLLTDRAVRTLLCYFSETSPVAYNWLVRYYKENKIPKDDADWSDLSGETFLRDLLSGEVELSKYDIGREDMYRCDWGHLPIDPRNIAQRIMDIRSQLAREFITDLKAVSEENSALMRETLFSSFSLENVVEHPLSRSSKAESDDKLYSDPEPDNSAADM